MKIIVDNSVEKIRPYCMAAIVKNINLTNEKIKEIMQWQEKVHSTIGRNRKKVALGYYVLDKIKFPIKYLAKTPKEIVFAPLDMEEKMDAIKILSRHPCGREYGPQLSNFEKFPVYYDSNNEVLSMPPIINSNNSGKILPNTKEILIECSGSDLEVLKKVITMAVVDLIDIGGKAYSVDIVYKNKIEKINLKADKMKLSLENTNKLLGLELKEKDLEKLLPKMGIEYSKGIALIPAWRTDVMHEVDIIEDVAIAYGYDKFIPEMPKVATIGEESEDSKRIAKLVEILCGLGLQEISTYHLIKPEEAQKHKIKCIELENVKAEYKLLRPNLLIPALRILSENKDNDYPQKIFEIGTVFHKSEHLETQVKENENLLIACSPANFTELKQILDYLITSLGKSYELKELSKLETIDGRTGAILLKGKPLGYIGECHPETLREWNIRLPVSVIEIDINALFE